MMTYPVLQVINRTAHLVLSVVVEHSVCVCPVKGSLYLQHKSTRDLAKIALRSLLSGGRR